MIFSSKIKFMTSCPEHQQHLCYLVNIRYHETNWEKYGELVAEAQFVCKQCGRVAAQKDHLCKPTKL